MNNIPKLLASSVIFNTLLVACGGGSSNHTADNNINESSNHTVISGSVGDGPIVNATVTIKNSQGVVLATTSSDAQANYSVKINPQTDDYPLIVVASNGTDLVTGSIPDFALISVVPNSTFMRANLNPHSTMIVQVADRMAGGITTLNLEQSRQAVVTKLNYGLDAELIDNPITTIIDGQNAAVITHASETMAEMLRRTSSVLGSDIDEEAIIHALAADLSDGALDGKGASGTEPLYTAISHVVGLQVLLETMLHNLHVNGVSAEAALTAAIDTTLGTSNRAYNPRNRIRITRTMLNQARAALTAIRTLDPSVSLYDLMQVLKALGDGATAEDMADALAQYRLDLSISKSLDTGISQTVNASNQEIQTINDTANNADIGTPTPPVASINNTPSISGNPSSAIAEGESYSFSPTAFDSDGDTLTFSISGRPLWSTFDSHNGTLSGIPAFSDAGTYSNIQISVSDGAASAALTPFSIFVSDTNRPPSISGNPVTEVTQGETYTFTPVASDPDNDNLSFSITNKPSWAIFDIDTGTLEGIPGPNDIGLNEGILIVVTDNTASSSLKAINLKVNAPVKPSSSAYLSWTIPTSRIDGNPLAPGEISGYRIYMGSTRDNLTMISDLNSRSATEYSVTNLTAGTYFFAITSYDTDGTESSFSNIAERIVL